MTGRVRRASATVVALKTLLLASAASAQVELDPIIRPLPGSHEHARVLAGADRVSITQAHPVGAAGQGTGDGLEYVAAYYRAPARAAEDMERLLATGPERSGSWQVLVRAGGEIHWIKGGCPLDAEGFRGVYARLVEQVEKEVAAVNDAALCSCGAPCRRIAVDR